MATYSVSAEALPGVARRMAENPAIAQEEPEKIARELGITQPIPNTFIYRVVVIALSAVTLLALACTVLLALTETSNANGTREMFLQPITFLGSTALGALAGLLSPGPNS
ncbi:hypothetical protein [Pontivivens ytuae]|uniref:Uncharacterized protein n=1 Tax=Pontivivens ytuae TaxID=2789856 RepID=A0A7S9QAN7_9RHOB|nr:hypothetical protein [Pontivivens ytuae]QPH52293.1 hypothetical protein I0K15_10665 [Pontivivens ytuae]